MSFDVVSIIESVVPSVCDLSFANYVLAFTPDSTILINFASSQCLGQIAMDADDLEQARNCFRQVGLGNILADNLVVQ